MKKIFCLGLLFSVFAGFSQDDARFGVSVGVNQYYMNNNFLSSKSEIGFSLGVTNTVPISDYSELLVEASITRFSVSLLARETPTTEPEWVKYNSDRIGLGVLYDYDILHFLDEDIAIGLSLGPYCTMYSTFKPQSSSKRDYLLDPYYTDSSELDIDFYNNVTFQAFVAAGITTRFRNWEMAFMYYKGITDTYRALPKERDYITPEGKDNFGAITLTYYFGYNF